jgi:hypothetical protein
VETTACQNIGPKERRLRMNTFWFWGAASLAAAVYVVAAQVAWPMRLLIFLPAAVAAFGLFQARANVCVAFVAANIKVLGDSRKERIAVTDDAERAAFKKAARKIYARGVASAAVFTALVALIP